MSKGYILGEQYACSDECALKLYDGDKAQMDEDLSHAEENDADFYYTEWPSIRYDDLDASPETYNVIMGDIESADDSASDNKKTVIVRSVSRVFSKLNDLECKNLIDMIENDPDYKLGYVSDMNGKREQIDVVFLDETLLQRVATKCYEAKLNFKLV
jgi:hypothetical protein